MAPTFCQHIYDVMGCEWNMPGNYGLGFDNCQGDSGEVRNFLTFHLENDHLNSVPSNSPWVFMGPRPSFRVSR